MALKSFHFGTADGRKQTVLVFVHETEYEEQCFIIGICDTESETHILSVCFLNKNSRLSLVAN